jgi:FlaA1/EpsC-like NDP-sugar epimerase
VDALVVGAAITLAYAIRFEGVPPGLYRKQFLLVLPYVVLLRLGIFGAFGVYRLVWRYVTIRDLPRIVGATLAGSLVLVAARVVVEPLFTAFGLVVNPMHATVPWGVVLADLVLCTMGIAAVRALWRFTTEEVGKRSNGTSHSPRRRNALLIGAGSAGVMVAREVKTNPALDFRVLGFLDDDPTKHRTIIHGFRVMGPTDRLPELSRKLGADLAVITIGDATGQAVRRIVNLAEETSMKVQIIPELNQILAGRVSISKVRDVAIEDLLRREQVDLDEDLIQRFVTGKRVLVTGAGGSIGSEICRQVCRFKPANLVLVDQAENPLFHIHRELRAKFAEAKLIPLVGNVTDRHRMKRVLQETLPEIIFHAAAHKHVPLMEANPGEAVRNNVGGSRLMADLAHEFGVDAFVMISTDKAVNPTSIMGATKRLAEMYVQALAETSSTRFLTVRFGNVLGSEGSVVPVFKEQIARGGPVTVTHPEMQRYFMTIPEASQLVLQASAMGRGGEIFVLEMGEPIPIVTLARDLIRLSGYTPGKDIEIDFIGTRPGEKLYEEINLSEENATKTRHPRVWIGASAAPDLNRTSEAVDGLLARLDREDPSSLQRHIAAAVPEYSPQATDGNSGSDTAPAKVRDEGKVGDASGF